jgi:ATP-dependent helicase/nuclease subunit A
MSAVLERANREQLEASDPAVSAFVAASAGSGKTKLLTDRLLRLMLAGAAPGRIQCLTFTKAAAAEMAVRLQHRLGGWVTLDDAALDGKLAELRMAPTPGLRGRARALFAEVLDLPGGMRIGTIHAFCQSLLRRFPLEAQLSPHFRLAEPADAGLALREAREDMLAQAATPEAREALDRLAGLISADGFGRLVEALLRHRDRLPAVLGCGPERLAAAQLRAAGASAGDDALILARAASAAGGPTLLAALREVQAKASPSIADKAGAMLDWLALPAALRAEHWDRWHEAFVSASGPRAPGGLLNKKLAEARPDLLDALLAEQRRVLAVADDRAALRLAQASAALLTLADPVLRAYAARKERDGLLDYDDLIGRTSSLLVDPGAAWVLFKLDGGLDHLLLDEVQDTAPAQWAIARALTEEFFAGEGAGAAGRSFFAVGDRKQSIYSFQGADIASFDASRAALRARVTAAGQAWRDTELDVSFRSTTPVLALVDAVFADPEAAAGVATPGTLRHHAARAGHAGRVELWPLAPRDEPPAPPPWSVAEANQGQQTAEQLLADRLAGWIAAQTDGTVPLPSRDRPLAPGDVLVLVRRRNAFVAALVRALKIRGVPVAGLDRLVLTEQPAVQDLLALCDTLLLPQDSLSLACVLTSPLGGLDDDALMALAAGRDGALWEALRSRAGERPDWQAAWHLLETLSSRVDYTTPHALLAEALGPLGGRARLLARLGPEAAEPIDELLGAALAYGGAHPPSLQGFLQWLRQSGAEVTREAEGAGSVVRVMTVHGAKGLQAPLVILPDTTAVQPDPEPLLWAQDAALGMAVPLWRPRREFDCDAVRRLQAEAKRRGDEEYHRLLYVALTRAEDRLVICGWQPRRGIPEESWYRLIERALAAMPGVAREAFAGWDGDALALESAQRARPTPPVAAGRGMSAAPLPAWAGAAPHWRPAAPPAEPALPQHLAPSRPEGVEHGPVPGAASPLAARDMAGARFRRGALVHALLQHLPDLPPDQRAAAAHAWLARPGLKLPPAAPAEIAADTLAVLDHPLLAPLFGPVGRAEVPLTGVVAGQVIGGLVDRLAVLPDEVLVVDFKTNRDPPERVEDTPVAYLSQLAAYRAVLQAIYPGRAVTCALVWTQGARVAVLPDNLLAAHAPRAGHAA